MLEVLSTWVFAGFVGVLDLFIRGLIYVLVCFALFCIDCLGFPFGLVVFDDLILVRDLCSYVRCFGGYFGLSFAD